MVPNKSRTIRKYIYSSYFSFVHGVIADMNYRSRVSLWGTVEERKMKGSMQISCVMTLCKYLGIRPLITILKSKNKHTWESLEFMVCKHGALTVQWLCSTWWHSLRGWRTPHWQCECSLFPCPRTAIYSEMANGKTWSCQKTKRELTLIKVKYSLWLSHTMVNIWLICASWRIKDEMAITAEWNLAK